MKHSVTETSSWKDIFPAWVKDVLDTTCGSNESPEDVQSKTDLVSLYATAIEARSTCLKQLKECVTQFTDQLYLHHLQDRGLSVSTYEMTCRALVSTLASTRRKEKIRKYLKIEIYKCLYLLNEFGSVPRRASLIQPQSG